jgi:hypothetical protein
MSLEGEGYDTRNGCLGEGMPPSCLRASIRYMHEVEGFGRELERSDSDTIRYLK